MLWKLLEICLLRAGPQDLPGASRFMLLMLTGYFLVDLLVAQLSFSFGNAVGVSVLDVLLLAAFTQLLLRGMSKLERLIRHWRPWRAPDNCWALSRCR